MCGAKVRTLIPLNPQYLDLISEVHTIFTRVRTLGVSGQHLLQGKWQHQLHSLALGMHILSLIPRPPPTLTAYHKKLYGWESVIIHIMYLLLCDCLPVLALHLEAPQL